MASRSELSIHHIIALLLRSVLKRVPDCTGVQKLKTFCTVWGSLTIVSASAKKIEQLLAFLPARKSGSFELPRASFFGWIFDIGGGGGVQEGKIAGRQPCILRKWPSFCHYAIVA